MQTQNQNSSNVLQSNPSGAKSEIGIKPNLRRTKDRRIPSTKTANFNENNLV